MAPSLPRRPSRAQLDDADLAGADLGGRVLRGAALAGRDLSGARLVDAVLVGADLSGADLSGADLSDAVLDGARLSGAKLVGARLLRARGDDVDLSGADLSRASLVGAVLERLRLDDAVLDGADLDQARIEGLSAVRARFQGARLTGADLAEGALSDARFERADMTGARLEGAVAAGASFKGATLLKARLDGADLSGADLEAADLRRAVISGARLDGVQLPQGLRAQGLLARRLQGASAELTALLEAEGARLGPGLLGQLLGGLKRRRVERNLKKIERAAIVPEAPAPSLLRRLAGALSRGQRPAAGELIPGADLSGRDLRRIKLAGLDLSGVDFTGCRLDGADLSGADLSGAVLEDARLDGARLSDAVLQGASAPGARFDDAVLRRAELGGFSASGASFIGARFAGARFEGASLVGADLSAARLADVDLADADLSNTLMEQADLAGAVLDRAVVRGAEVDGALGLSPETLDQLEARGARVSRFSLVSLARSIGAARAFKLAALGSTVLVGGYLVYQFGLPRNADTDALKIGADDAAQAGEIELALENYRKLLELAEAPVERVNWRLEMVAIYTEAERYGEAIDALKLAIADAEGEPDLQVELRLRYARLLVRSGQADQAVAAYGALVEEELEPEVLAQAIVGLSELYTEQGRADEALALQQQILDRYPNNQGLVVTLSISIAELYSAASQDQRALEALDRIWSYPLEDDQRAALMVAKARTYEALGDPGQALDVYSALLRTYPTYDRVSGELLLSMAQLFYHQGDAAQSQALLSQIEEKGGAPQVLARAQLLAASIDERGGDLDAARRRYEAVIAGYPTDRDALETARVGLVRILVSQNPDASLDEGIIESDDPEVIAQILLGQAQRREDVGDVEAAAALYQRVIDETPDATGAVDTARFRQAGLLASVESYAEAINAYRELLSEASDADSKMVIEAAIAEAYMLAGQVGNAETAYTSLLTGAAPDSEAAGLARIGLGQVAEARGNTETARRSYQRVIDEVSDPTLVGAALKALADSYLDSGRDEEAMQIYRRFLATLPEGHPAVFSTRRAMAGILERRGETAAALELYDALIAGAPDTERRIEVALSRAELLETSGDSGAARAAYQALLDGRALSVTDREDAAVGLARSTLELGEAGAALAVSERFESTVETQTTLASLLQVRAQAYRALGQVDRAAALSERILELAGEDGDAAFSARMDQANALLNEGEFEGAIATYRALIEEVEDRPTVAALKNSVAQAMLASGDPAAAAAAYQAVVDLYGDLSEARFSAGMGLADIDRFRGEPEAAVARYQTLVAPDAGSEVWRLGQLASALSDSQDAEGAEAIYKSLINDHTGDARAQAAGRMGWAGLLHARDEFQAARELYLAVAASSPDPVEREWARLRAANTLADEGSDDEALASLGRLIEDARDPEVTLQARLGTAAILLERGGAAEGLALLDGLDAGPLGPAWVATLVQQRVACLVVMGDYDRAGAEWERVLQRWGALDDAASQARLGLGDLAVETGDTAAALERYDRVLSDSGDRHYQAQAVLGRAAALRAAGRTAEARAAYQRLLDDYGEQRELAVTAAQALAKLSD